MKGLSLAVRLLLLFALFSFQFATIAKADQLGFFFKFIIDSMKKGYPTGYLETAARELSAVEFFDSTKSKSDSSAMYSIFWNKLLLDKQMLGQKSGQRGRLKPLSEMSGSEVGLLYHELWHVYFKQKLSQDHHFRQWFSEFALYHYGDLSKSKRLEALEELYGVFIQNVIQHYYFLERHLPAKTKYERLYLCKQSNVETLDAVQRRAYEGYYTEFAKFDPRDLSSFLSKKLVMLKPDSLSPQERVWITTRLFENKLNF